MAGASGHRTVSDMPVAELPALDPAGSPTGCCALIDPAQWDGRCFSFAEKLFVMARTRGIFHVPIDMGSVMRRAQAAIDGAGVRSPDALILSREVSPWRALHYIAVTGPVPGMDTVHLSGRFLTKVFEGPFRDAGRWQERLLAYTLEQHEQPLQSYFFYTVCPKCAKTYGTNYVVGFQQVA